MPKFKNWSNKGDGEWEFDDKIIIKGERVKPVVHVYRWGSSANEPTDYFAELYFPNVSAEVEELSNTIDRNGKVSDYAQPESNREKAKDYARKFMDRVQYEGGILQAVNATAIEEGEIPDGWNYVEHDTEYILFDKQDNWDYQVAVDQEETGDWQVSYTEDGQSQNVVEAGLSFQEALETAKDYMRVN